MKSLRVMLFGHRRRMLERDELRKFLQVKVIIEGLKYNISDFSNQGFSIHNEAGAGFEVGKQCSCILTLRGDPKLTIKVKVRRVDGKLIGCEVIDTELFERFVDNNLRLPKKIN